jgi:hypothetical protein
MQSAWLQTVVVRVSSPLDSLFQFVWEALQPWMIDPQLGGAPAHADNHLKAEVVP